MMNLEDFFKTFLQRNVVFSIDNKIVKEGNLILYKQTDYYLNLYLKTNNQEQKKFEIPYPFSIEKYKNYYILNYTLSSISKGDSELYYRLMSLNYKKNSRFFDTKILIFEKNSFDLKLLV
jgi:hypothetical protein